MKQVRKSFTTPGCCFRLQTKMIINDKEKWKSICCPVSPAVENADYCGPWCAWYSEDRIDVGPGASCLTNPGRLVAFCQDKEIGEIVDEPD